MIANQMIIGTSLPELSNPATAENLAAGKQAIDSSGEIITGTAEVCDMLANLGTATAADVTSGKTFTSAAGLKIAGTHICSVNISSTAFRPNRNDQVSIPNFANKKNLIFLINDYLSVCVGVISILVILNGTWVYGYAAGKGSDGNILSYVGWNTSTGIVTCDPMYCKFAIDRTYLSYVW